MKRSSCRYTRVMCLAFFPFSPPAGGVGRYRQLWPLLGVLALTACGGEGTPPSVALITPANDATVSGTTAVQVTLADAQAKAEVQVYVRSRGGTETGQLVGTVNSSPYIVTWNTASYPSKTDLEVYAKATVDGATGTSTPVRVQVQNATAPTLSYLVAYNLPSGLTSQHKTRARPAGLDARSINGPSVSDIAVPRPSQGLRSQATSDRQLAVEWGWPPVEGASGYRLVLSKSSIAGAYEVIRTPAASAGKVALERSSYSLQDQTVGNRLYGALRSLTTNNVESALSNAETAVFLDTQQVASPAQGQKVADGRPILTWTPLTGVSGYLYFLCDRPCTQDDSKFLWTNYPTTTSELSATYPTKSEALKAGTYYWWVAGVRKEKGVTVSLSYSEQRSLVVP